METASLHDVSTQEQNALLTLALISIGYNPGTGAPRRLKLRTGPARSFIETIPSPSYSLFPTTFDAPRPASSTIYLKASNIEGRHDGRERVSRNLRREWRDFLTCLGRLASGAQPCPCQSAASNECECNTVALCQHLRSMFLSLPEWRTIAAYDNAKDIKLHLRGMLDISDRFTADPNDHTFDATLEVVSCQLNKHGLRLIRSGLRFTVERLDQGTGEWAPVPNPPRGGGALRPSKPAPRQRPPAKRQVQRFMREQPSLSDFHAAFTLARLADGPTNSIVPTEDTQSRVHTSPSPHSLILSPSPGRPVPDMNSDVSSSMDPDRQVTGLPTVDEHIC